MARSSKALLLAAILASVCVAPATAETYAGVQGLMIVGFHRDAAGQENGVGGGPLIELHAGNRHFAFHIEGIPVVGIPDVKPSVAYGQATPSVGVFNGQGEFAISPDLWLGVGETIYNQRTPLPAIGQTVSSRLAGMRFTARYHHATSNNHFVEGNIGAAPTLRGADRYVYLDGSPTTEKPERASSIDLSLALGYTKNSTTWLFGLRHLNFAAQFVNTGEAADRNVGIGPMIEWRHAFK